MRWIRIKNIIGYFKGYGRCLRCKDSWYWKEHQIINYSINSGMFPICKECFDKISSSEILYYCIILMNDIQHLSKSIINKRIYKLQKSIKEIKNDKN